MSQSDLTILSRAHGYFIRQNGQLYYRDGVPGINGQNRPSKNGSYHSTDGGATFNPLPTGVLHPVRSGDIIRLTSLRGMEIQIP